MEWDIVVRRPIVLGATLTVKGVGAYISALPNGAYDEAIFAALRQCVRPDSICLDLGANVGIMTAAMSALAVNGRVLAVEPEKRTFDFLSENIASNGLDNATAVRALLAAKPERRTFLYNSANPACSTSVAGDFRMAEHTMEKIIMPTVPVDELVPRYGLQRVDFIKIDCEGAELEILEGAAGTLDRHRPIVVLEFNAFALMTFGRINPADALDRIMERFPLVYFLEWRMGEGHRPVRIQNRYDFLYHHVLTRQCIDNLVCSFDPIN